jgi:hypothetical protein
MFRWLIPLLVAVHAAPAAAQAPLSLHCARGVPDYPDAEMVFSESGSHFVDIVFVGYRPSKARAEWSLRDCLNTAAKVDGSRPILARLWYRERGGKSPRVPLAPDSLALGSSAFGSSFSSVATR